MSAVVDLLLESSLRAPAVALLIGAVLLVSRSRTSSLRHAAWTFALAAMLLMPALVRLAPDLPAIVPLPAVPMLSGDLAADDAGAGLPPSLDALPRTFGGPAKPRAERVVGEAGESGGSPTTVSLSPVQIVLAIWAAGAIVCLARMAAGLWWMRRLQQGATRIDVPGIDARTYASAAAAVPMTVGIFRPRILLPADWSAWPSARLAAVLAHETAHARRRDALVLFAAAVNRGIFWFHPLAWWLARTLAATAEETCDAAAVRAIGSARQYAHILLAIADEARRGHGRVAWAAVGIHGAGRFHRRIDRILRGTIERPASWARATTVLIACSIALLLVVACRQQVTVALELQPDPTVADRLMRQRATNDFYKAGVSMTVEEVGATEAAIKRNPEDLTARKKLLIFYRNSGQKVVGWDKMIVARRPHLLWLIQHHPENDLAAWTAQQGLSPTIDPTTYAECRRLWLAATSKPTASAAVLGNAATFFEPYDKSLAEQLLLRARSVDPGGPQPRIDKDNMYHSPWSRRLGMLYAGAIVGSTSPATRQTDPAATRTPFAAHARKMLDESTDVAVLTDAGSFLTRYDDVALDVKPMDLARRYLERATKLQPDGQAQRVLDGMKHNDRWRERDVTLLSKKSELAGGEIARKVRARETLTPGEWETVDDLEAQAVASLQDSQRLAYLPWLASVSYMMGEYYDTTKHDVARAKKRWDRSRQYARDLLGLAEKSRSDPAYPDAVYHGNVVLGLHALREGDVKTAVRYMRAAGNAPPSSTRDELGVDSRLMNYLLKVGERASVVDFLEQTARIYPSRKPEATRDAAAIRAGKMPESYQYMVTPR